MSTDYPNLIPPDGLRLPDAVTVTHGPARLLANFVLQGDRVARRAGLRLKLRHDMEQLNDLNQRQVELGNWYPLVNMFDPARSDCSPANAFWISGENDAGEIISTAAARIYHWPDTTLEDEAVRMLYGHDDGQPCVITAKAAKLITGVISVAGAAWVRPDYRRRELSHLLPRIAKAYALSRWPLDWAVGYVTKLLVEKGVAAGYGQKHFSYSIEYPELPFGELVLAYTSGQEAYDDLGDYLMTELSSSTGTKFSAPSFSMTREHAVMKTSSDGVFHGSSSRS